jgi:hypothetical protein
MPIHDWTRVSAGTFHAFHNSWIAELQGAMNAGILPPNYYALAEQVAGDLIPDMLTLQDIGNSGGSGLQPSDREDRDVGEGIEIAVATMPPKVSVCDTITEAMLLAARQSQLVIRHTTGDRIVAILELVSLGNKERAGALESFIEKVIGSLDKGYHFLLVDLYPPGPYDPRGMHGAIWEHLKGSYLPPVDKPLTLAAYVAAGAVTCYVEPTTVGDKLIPMPLFLSRETYINVPLEKTYLQAYDKMPNKWKRILESGA